MALKLPPHVKRQIVRNKVYYYLEKYRGTGKAEPRIRLPDLVHEPEAFWADYAQRMGLPAPRINTDAFDHLIDAYVASPELGQLKHATKRQYKRHHKLFRAWWGELEVRGLSAADILYYRDLMSDTPAEANAMLRSLSALLSWSIPRGYRDDNPCEHVKKLRIGEGWRPWPWEAVELVRDFGPRWMWEAAALALYSGQRESDVLKMPKNKRNGGLLTVKQDKTGIELVIPAHRDLLNVFSEMEPKSSTIILTNTRGLPWTTDGFRTSWGKALVGPLQRIKDEGLVFHGLRKSSVVMLLEAGCTDAMVRAVTGQSQQMIEHYARQVNQKKLARAAILTWEQETEQRTNS